MTDMTQTFKQIIARPSHSVALFIEIIIVTIIGWIAIEPVAVNTTIAMLPAGYEYDRLININISKLNPEAEGFDSTLNNAEDIIISKDQLLRMIRDRKGVEAATFNSSYMSIESEGYAQSFLPADSIYKEHAEEGERNGLQAYKVVFLPNSDFFKTFGIKDIKGNPVKDDSLEEDVLLISNTLAQALYPSGNMIGKDVYPFDEEKEEAKHTPIGGITQDIIYNKGRGRTAIIFQPESNYAWFNCITLRLAAGVNPRDFVDKLSNDLFEYKSGDVYLDEPKLYSDMREEVFSYKKKDLTQKWIILGFFLANVLLGVAGNFYVQCKSRIPVAGVMRAFGATRRRIERNIVSEAWLTVFIGWLIGSILYLIYLKNQGFPMESDTRHVIQAIQPLWYDTKFGRYSIIGVIILLVLLATATLGSLLPARRVGRVPIVDSLRDE